MNKERRQRLRAARSRLEDIKSDISNVLDEEDEARENTSENLTFSERYERSEECSEAIGNAIEHISDAIDAIEEAL